jgi:hypothetical protein
VAFTAALEGDAQRNFISLSPQVGPLDAPATVYYDGLVLLEGAWPTETPPNFSDPSGRTGTWNGKPFINLIRNASAESSGFRLRPWVDKIGTRFLPDKGSNQPSIMLYYLLDERGASMYQYGALQVLFRTFWARFGWGQVPLLYNWIYSVILTLALAGVIGAMIAFWRKRKVLPWAVIVLFGLVFCIVWLQTFTRGSNYPTQLRAIYYPTARYAYPAIIPTMGLLCLGWLQIASWIKLKTNLPVIWFKALYISGWLVFDLLSILSIVKYYYSG